MNKIVRAGVGIMILKDNKLLLGKRNDDSEQASSELHGEGMWTMPGGKVDFGEKIQDAARRELREETGLFADKLELVSVGNEITNEAHFVTLGFLCKDFSGEARAMEPEEIVEWRWFPMNRLPTPMYPPTKKLLENFVSKNIYKGD